MIGNEYYDLDDPSEVFHNPSCDYEFSVSNGPIASVICKANHHRKARRRPTIAFDVRVWCAFSHFAP